jgi:hypothetical protein
MSARRTGIFVFPASSYESAHEIIGRLSQANFPRAAMFVDRSGEDYEVTLHTHEDNQGRAERAVYGHGYLGKLAVAGAVVALGGAIWSLWKSSRSDAYRGFDIEQRGSAFRGSTGLTNTDTASTRLADTSPPGSLGPTATRHQEAAEAGAMPIS